MPTIDLFMRIRKDKGSVYGILKAMDQFPSFVNGIKHIKITKKMGNMIVAEWKINIDGANIIWIERATFYDKDMKIKFKMLEGDYDQYEGQWVLEDAPHGTILRLVANINWGAPGLMKFVGPLIEKKTRRALRGLLLGIKRKAETNE